MIVRFRHYWQEVRTSFWFLPAVIVAGAVGLAVGLVAIDASIDRQMLARFPLLFGAGADGSRGLLTAVATSMITVAGVVFSITIVALSLASSQYTSRVLRTFRGDRINQVVLGVFVGIFAYCLVVLRTIRGGAEGMFVPSLAVMGGFILALLGIAYLIYFIHHIALSIQASSIIHAAAVETMAAIDRLFPNELGEAPGDDDPEDGLTDSPREAGPWIPVPSRRTGYISSVDGDGLLELASELNGVLRMERAIGQFVAVGEPLVSLTGVKVADDDVVRRLNCQYLVNSQRTVDQDASFGVRQIVDVALKALSPGVNDTTTAVMCVDFLSALLSRMAGRQIVPAHRLHEGELRVIACGTSFERMLEEAFDQIRQSGRGNVVILTRLLQALERIARFTTRPARRKVIRQQLSKIKANAVESVPEIERGAFEAAADRLILVLAGVGSAEATARH